jgi:hypothetical protein
MDNVQNNITFQHSDPVALVNDLICVGSPQGATCCVVLVDCWCATLSILYKRNFYKF